MSRSTNALFWNLAVGLAAVTAPAARAQFAPPQSPAVSPYLNLLRTGSPMYLNYYGLVQPQLQAQQQFQNLQGQLDATNANLGAGIAGGGSGTTTGQPWGYFTHRGYFLNNRGGGGGGGFGGRGFGGGQFGGGGFGGGQSGGQFQTGTTGGFGTNPYGNPRGIR